LTFFIKLKGQDKTSKAKKNKMNFMKKAKRELMLTLKVTLNFM